MCINFDTRVGFTEFCIQEQLGPKTKSYLREKDEKLKKEIAISNHCWCCCFASGCCVLNENNECDLDTCSTYTQSRASARFQAEHCLSSPLTAAGLAIQTVADAAILGLSVFGCLCLSGGFCYEHIKARAFNLIVADTYAWISCPCSLCGSASQFTVANNLHLGTMRLIDFHEMPTRLIRVAPPPIPVAATELTSVIPSVTATSTAPESPEMSKSR